VSFICGLCKEQQPNGTKANIVVTRKRKKEYPLRFNVFRFFNEEEGEHQFKDDPGGVGWEPMKEAHACPMCAEVAKMRERYEGDIAARREAEIRSKRKAEKRQRELLENREKVDRVVRRLSGRERDGSRVRT
jgi:rubredoxin